MRGFAAIGLHAPKTEPNVGGAMRAAHCFGAAFIRVEGARYRERPTDTTKASRHIPLFHGPLTEGLPRRTKFVVVEVLDGAVPLPQFVHPERAIYVFGAEDGSVPVSVIERADALVTIPTAYCMNLAATVNVVLYDRMVKQLARTQMAAA